MFSIGEQVLNRKTGRIGKVIGYGHEVLDSGYTPTLKVLVAGAKNSGRRGAVEEDLDSNWAKCLSS
jgi:hypothetical protein